MGKQGHYSVICLGLAALLSCVQKKLGSPTADRASCPGARPPAPVPQQAVTLPEARAALEAPGALAGVGAGAGAKGRDTNVER